MSRQERGAMRAKIAARRAGAIVEEATARVVAARPTVSIDHGKTVGMHPSQPSSPQDQAAEVKRLRDGGMAWWQIGQQLGLARAASSAAEPEAKRGAGAARRLYAAANRGEVPRTQAVRKGVTPKPTGPASRAVPAYMRKEQLVNEGHVIPRDMPDEEVEVLLHGRRIEWAIDMARLTNTPADQWGGEGRWVKQEARVHVDLEWVKVVDRSDEGKDRVVYFREYGGRDKDGRHMSGPTRCVRVDAIYTVA
jgi:hypothetical protein